MNDKYLQELNYLKFEHKRYTDVLKDLNEEFITISIDIDRHSRTDIRESLELKSYNKILNLIKEEFKIKIEELKLEINKYNIIKSNVKSNVKSNISFIF